MGRTVREGVVHVHGEPLPPLTRQDGAPGNGSLVDLLRTHPGLRPTSISLSELRESDGSSLRARIGEGFNALAIDAENDADLDAVARAVMDSTDITPVGSAGLASALARVMVSGRTVSTPRVTLPAGPKLVVCGSFNPVSRRQIRSAEAAGVGVSIILDPDAATGDWVKTRAYAASLLPGIGRLLDRDVNPVLSWPLPDAVADPPQGRGRALSAFAGALLYGLVSRAKIGAFVLIGGETAYSALSAVGASTLDVSFELEPGIPVARIADGTASGATVVTKSGGFGDDQTLLRILGPLHHVR